MTPPWPQIRGLTYSTIGRNLVGTMHAGPEPRRVFYGHPGRWRTEDADGAPVWIDTPTDSWNIPGDGTAATHRVKNARALVSYTGLGPRQLFQPHRWWPAENRFSQTDIGDPDGPTPVEVHGRPGHELVFPNAGSPITVVIDVEIGVALRWEQGGEVIELSDPEIDVTLDPTLFAWNGPVVDEDDPTVSDEQRAHETKMQAVAEMPTTDVGYLPLSTHSSAIDGDPLTGALDLSVHGQTPQVVVRRWLTALPEPEAPFHVSHLGHAWRREIAPWSVELRAHGPLDDDEVDRIVGSLRLPDPPGDIAALRREDGERRRHIEAQALLERLGTGRSLAELLDSEYSPSLLVRTDFSDDARWADVAQAAMEPVESGDSQFPTFEANLVCVDHPENEGLTATDLVNRTGDDPPFYAFIADAQSMSDPEMSVLAVDLGRTEWGHEPGRTFRVIPSEMSSVENNLSISNMDFRDFADSTDDDGVFRGFPPPLPVVGTLDRDTLLAIAASGSSRSITMFAAEVADDPHAACELRQQARSQLRDWIELVDNFSARPGAGEFLAAASHDGVVHSGHLPRLMGGYWTILVDPDTGTLEAALLIEAPHG
ncbi:DUF6924 domain-containing protein [Williamsia deligens]|uniref:DUF6924 domain-containing protein n=1 Tax=Williamsia deligens TaxID=321325 RepID=A0ABW3G586_9NOCA|nr:hypothetical protein [Williamsia deligens]MCP2193688.1 hypothetical protein [Williamsia deligens]